MKIARYLVNLVNMSALEKPIEHDKKKMPPKKMSSIMLDGKLIVPRVSTIVPCVVKKIEYLNMDILHGEKKGPKGTKKKLEFTYLVIETSDTSIKKIVEIINVQRMHGNLLNNGEDGVFYNLLFDEKKCCLTFGRDLETMTMCDALVIDTAEGRYVVCLEISMEMSGYCEDYNKLISNLKYIDADINGYTRINDKENITFGSYKY